MFLEFTQNLSESKRSFTTSEKEEEEAPKKWKLNGS